MQNIPGNGSSAENNLTSEGWLVECGEAMGAIQLCYPGRSSFFFYIYLSVLVSYQFA
jgi:hypothetical protein